MKILLALTTVGACLRSLGLVALALLAAPPSALAQDAHGAIAFGQTAYGEAVAYGFAWNYSVKDEAIDAALNACRAGGGTNCEELAWFQNGCGALVVDQYGNGQAKGAMTQEQAEARAVQICEARGGSRCTVVGSQCASPGGEADTWSGSEHILAVSDVEDDDRRADAQAGDVTVRDELLTREQRLQVQMGLAALGFDAGPADGLFGPRTRAAIWDWQEAKGLDATGYLRMTEAKALTTIGIEAANATKGTDEAVEKPAVSAAIAQEPERRPPAPNSTTASTLDTTVMWMASHIDRNACKSDSPARYSANASRSILVMTVIGDYINADRYCHRNCIVENQYEMDFGHMDRSFYSIVRDYSQSFTVELRNLDHDYTVVRDYDPDVISGTASRYGGLVIPFCGASAQANALELDSAVQRLFALTGQRE